MRSRRKQKIRLVIDTDPGVDDAIALFAALVYQGVDIRLISTTYGNADIETTTKNLFRIVSVFKSNCSRSLPEFSIAKGSFKPIKRKYHPYMKIHGSDALGDSNLPYENLPVSDKSAEDEIFHQVNKFKNEISILCLGPLTNLAKFALKYPGACVFVKEVVIMGGAFGYPGNYNPMVEANFGWDPDAVDIVKKAAFPKITVVPLNVTESYQVSLNDLENINSAKFKMTLIKILRNYIDYYRTQKEKRFDGGALHDAVALFCLLNKDGVKTREITFNIKKSGSFAGHVYSDSSRKNLNGSISVVSQVDYQKLKKFIFSKLNDYSK